MQDERTQPQILPSADLVSVNRPSTCAALVVTEVKVVREEGEEVQPNIRWNPRVSVEGRWNRDGSRCSLEDGEIERS